MKLNSHWKKQTAITALGQAGYYHPEDKDRSWESNNQTSSPL